MSEVPGVPLFDLRQTMSSREIADLTGSRHDKVKQSVERLAARKNALGVALIDLPPLGEYLDGLGRPAGEYHLTKRDSFVVVAQLCPQFTAALVDRWQELEQQLAKPSHVEALRLYADQLEETQRVTDERDKAIATKALIGSRREATAMATASAASREAAQLKQQLGRGVEHATIAAVEKALGRPPGDYSFVPMTLWCQKHKDEPLRVDNHDHGFVLAWPAGAWLSVHKVDLVELFGAPRTD